MTLSLFQILFLILTYLVAATPFGLVLAKLFANVDIRTQGSKNIGATNVARVVGKKIGFATLLLDGLKGAIMIIIARFSFFAVEDLHLFLGLVTVIAVLGHVFPIYLKFKGGKGVATTIASLLALDPLVGILTVCVWIIIFCLFRISSLSSLISSFGAIILSIILASPISQIYVCVVLFVIILIRHKENITRLIAGEEKKL